jgi:OmpA-OmpF porin, OOP family
MKKYIGLTLGVVIGFSAIAQTDNNLVENGSFETLDGKLKKDKQINVAKGWDSPTALKADLFSITKEGLPCYANSNKFGGESPAQGENFAGIIAYSYNNKEPRTYIQTKLVGPLKKDVEYCVKFYVSLGDLSKYAVNNLGVFFGKDKLSIDSKADIIFDKEKDVKQIRTNSENKVYNGRFNWEPVCATFKAQGKEEYITIGNFFNNKDTKFEKLKPATDFKGVQLPIAYYYIDNVQVFVMESPGDCDCSMSTGDDKTQGVIYRKDFASKDGFTVDEQIKLATIYFDNLKTRIETMMMGDMENITKIMKEDASIKLEIIGHSEKSEVEFAKTSEVHQGLARNRAQAVVDYFVSQGISADRFKIVSHDDTKPAATSDSELDKAKNRRVEFKLIK